MANANADQQLVDQIAEAFSVNTTRFQAVVSDTAIQINAVQNDSSTAADLTHTITVRSKSEALITAIGNAVLATGRP